MLAQNCESDGSMSGMPSQCGRKRGSVPDGAASQGMSTTLSRRCLWGVADRASPVVADYIPTDRDMSRVRNGNPYRFLIGVGNWFMLCSNFGLVSPFQLWMEKPPLWARLLLPVLRHTFSFFFSSAFVSRHTYIRTDRVLVGVAVTFHFLIILSPNLVFVGLPHLSTLQTSNPPYHAYGPTDQKWYNNQAHFASLQRGARPCRSPGSPGAVAHPIRSSLRLTTSAPRLQHTRRRRPVVLTTITNHLYRAGHELAKHSHDFSSAIAEEQIEAGKAIIKKIGKVDHEWVETKPLLYGSISHYIMRPMRD
jgi:hypothetical protein